MSICSNSLRALPRSCIAPVRTFLPFLYHTATIQRWKPTAIRPPAHRNISTPSDAISNEEAPPERTRDIPFEDGVFRPQTDNANPKQRSTITGTERAAFQKLYRKFNTQGRAKSDQTHYAEIDQIADEYWEEDEEDPTQAMDDLFDEVLQGTRYSRGVSWGPEKKRSGEGLDSSIEGNTSVPKSSMAQSKKREMTAKAAQLADLRRTERERVDALLQNAQTDHELWQILDREVLDQVRKLDLDKIKKDAPAKPPKDQSGGKPEADPRILFQNYPHHLTTALGTLRTVFPASPLPLCFIPTIKSLGRSAYALGATTTLYKHLLRYAWLQRASYSQIDQLLIDMHNGAIEYDDEILAVIDAVIKEHDMALSSRLGREMQMVYQMEQYLEGIQKIKEWRRIVAERLRVTRKEHKEEGKQQWRISRELSGE